MTGSIDALAADRAALLTLGRTLSAAQWQAESGCPGWSVKDVIAHLGALYWVVADPSELPDVDGLPTEKAQEVLVDARRSLPAEEILADYESVSSRALEILAGLAGESFEVPLGDFGTYPAAVIPTAFCFDHYLHIRADLFAPRGPLTGPPPPSDDLRLLPALDWIEAALPEQNQSVLSTTTGAIEIAIEGVGARTITVGSGAGVAHVAGDAHTVLLCVTGRASWDDAGLSVEGTDHGLRALRSLRVF